MTTLVLSILNESSSFLQTRRTSMKAWMSLNFVKIPSLIMEVAPLEHLKNAIVAHWASCLDCFAHCTGQTTSYDLCLRSL